MFIRNIPEFVSAFIQEAQDYAYAPPKDSVLVVGRVNLAQLATQCRESNMQCYLLGAHIEANGFVLEIQSLEACYADLLSLERTPMSHPCMIISTVGEALDPKIDITLIHGYGAVVDSCSFKDNPDLDNLKNTKEVYGFLYSIIYGYLYSRKRGSSAPQERRKSSYRSSPQYSNLGGSSDFR